jgi:phosphoglycerate dehydrogenase-like enzyme
VTDTLFITTPLEAEHVERMRAVTGTAIDIIYEPDLLPPTRFTADHGGLPSFKRNEEQVARWNANLARATILWDMPIPVGTELLDVAPNVKWVQTTSSGVGQMVKRLGLIGTDVHVTTAKGVHAEPLAEFALTTILHHVKQVEFLQAEQAKHRWERYCGNGLSGKTMLIIGAGLVGGQVGKLAQAFGMKVAALVNTPSPERAGELNADSVHGVAELMTLLPQADFIVLCVPHTPDTEQLINAAAIKAMKPGVVFVNIARGQVVEEPALIEALKSGHIGYAGLDVAAIEPLPVDSPLWDMKNVLISPHSASTVASENARITEIFCQNVPLYLAGRTSEMRNLLNKARLY